MSKVLALEEVGKCYETRPKYYPTVYPTKDGKPNRKIQEYEPLNECIFAWRLQPSYRTGGYLLNTTAGIPDDSDGSVLYDANGRLLYANGPLHFGDVERPEWSVDKESYDKPEDEKWEIRTYGILTTTKKVYYNKNIICKTSIVQDGAGSNYANGCYTYNYSVTSNHRWGYIGLPGLYNGGPIISKKFDVTRAYSELNCATADREIVRILVPGESCGKDGFFEMKNNEGSETKPKLNEARDGDSAAKTKPKNDLYEEY